MGRWTYYSPLLLGFVFILLLNDSLREQQWMLPLTPLRQWLAVLGLAVGFGLLVQLVMVGAQGAFAQVLPVPGGRSFRGRPAVLGGASLVAAVAATIVAAFLYNEGLRSAAWTLGVVAAVAYLLVCLVYFWSMPIAVHDFGARGD